MNDEIAVEFDTFKDLTHLLSLLKNLQKRKEIAKADIIYIYDYINDIVKNLNNDLLDKKVCPECGNDLTKEYIPEEEQFDAIFRLVCHDCDFKKEVYE